MMISFRFLTNILTNIVLRLNEVRMSKRGWPVLSNRCRRSTSSKKSNFKFKDHGLFTHNNKIELMYKHFSLSFYF